MNKIYCQFKKNLYIRFIIKIKFITLTKYEKIYKRNHKMNDSLELKSRNHGYLPNLVVFGLSVSSSLIKTTTNNFTNGQCTSKNNYLLPSVGHSVAELQ